MITNIMSSSNSSNRNTNERHKFQRIMDSGLRLCQSADCFNVCVILCCLLPTIFILCLIVPKAMADDGLTTVDEIMKVLMEAMVNCEHELNNSLPPKDENGEVYKHFCKGEWDSLTCWPNSPPGSTVSVKCPEYIVDFDHSESLTRFCKKDGSWHTLLKQPNLTWSDYSRCPKEGQQLNHDEIMEFIKSGGNPKTRTLIELYTVGYSFSLVALTFAMIILAYFKRLHCTRNYIHMHLFASFILRAVFIFVKDGVLFYGSGILDVRDYDAESSLEVFKSKLNETGTESDSYLIGCKIVMTLFRYFLATNYYWILVEALYLHSLIFVAFFSDKKYLWRFIITGWGVPILFVVPWAIVRATLDDTGCWDIAVLEYKWIFNGPIVVANVINFLLFLNIIRVLWYKMRERGPINRTDNRRQYKKLAKSTLVLIPMFGVHAIVFIGMPDSITSGPWWDVRMYFDLFFNSFQGFFVAIIYCFCNGEVQAEFRKAWERFNLSVEIQKGRRDRSTSSVTMLTNFNSFASQQGRLSIGGQSNGKGSCRSNGFNMSTTAQSSTVDTKTQYTSKSEVTSTTELTEFNNESVDNEANVALLECDTPRQRPPFIRTQSGGIYVGAGQKDFTIPIAKETHLEEEFESAVEVQIENQLACPADSFKISTESGNMLEEEVDHFQEMAIDSVPIDRDTFVEGKVRGRRAASEDSGISSTGCYSQSANRNSNCLNESAAVSERSYCESDNVNSADENYFMKTNVTESTM